MTTASPGARHGPLRPLQRNALVSSAPDAARVLLGRVLRHEHLDGSMSLARIVEVEAYAPDDPASHSSRGCTPSNASMFAAPGLAYVYRSYGVHWCVNVSVGPDGVGTAVLLRAALVLAGEAGVRARRPHVRSSHDLLRGPGNLTSGMDIDGPRHDGLDLLAPGGALSLHRDEFALTDRDVAMGPRVGVSQAADVPWRFWLRNAPEVSRYRRSPRAGGPAGSGYGAAGPGH